MRRLATTLLLAACAAACVPVAPGSVKPAPITKGSKKPGPSPNATIASLPPVVGGGTGGNLITNGGNNVISHNGAGAVATTLTGRVTAPPGLLSNNGAGLVTNGGGNVVSNGGGNLVTNGGAQYRTLQAAESPYAGAKVFLIEATGAAVKGKDGQPAYAVTDAAGRYGFTGALPEASNYLLAVELPGGKGQLGAIATKGAERATDVSLVSTLTTGYILSQYVRGRDEAQATLDKLPGEVEKTTRERAAAALAGGTTPIPEALTDAQVVETVEALREQNAAFNTQMEEVRRLLVAAGSLNLGEGQVATEVALPLLRAVMPTADGGFYLFAPLAERIFRVTPEGRLTTAAGAAGSFSETWEGPQPADKTPLMPLVGMALDAEGRLLVVERRRVSRRMPDGTLVELWKSADEVPVAVGAGPAGALWVVTAQGLHKVAADGASGTKTSFGTADVGFLRRVTGFGRDTAGRIYLYTGPAAGAPAGEVRRLDPTAGTLESWVAPRPDLKGLALDPEGRVYLQAQDGAVSVKQPGGEEQALRGAAAKLVAVNGSLAIGPAGKLYWAYYGTVYRLDGDTQVAVAGRTGAGVDTSGHVSLPAPGGLAVAADGALFVSAFSTHEILRIQGQDVSTFAGNRTAELTGDGGPAVDAGIKTPTVLRRDAAGNVYVLQAAQYIRKIGTDGKIQTIHTGVAEQRIYDFVVTADGTTLYLSGVFTTPSKRGLVQKVVGGQVTTMVEGQAGEPLLMHVMALDATNTLHLMGGKQLRRWDGSAFQVVASHDSLVADNTWAALARATFDPQGRFWYATGKEARQLNRLTLPAGTVEVMAGTGGKVLNGEGVDDTLFNAMSPVFDGEGSLLVVDRNHNQIKRVPAKDL